MTDILKRPDCRPNVNGPMVKTARLAVGITRTALAKRLSLSRQRIEQIERTDCNRFNPLIFRVLLVVLMVEPEDILNDAARRPGS